MNKKFFLPKIIGKVSLHYKKITTQNYRMMKLSVTPKEQGSETFIY